MENITLPKSGQYVEAVKTAKSMMFRLAFTEYYPEPLTYEEIQAIDATLLRLNDAEVYNEFVVQGVDASVFRRVFHELLTDPHNTEDWQNVTEPLYFSEERFVKRLEDEGKDDKYIQFYIEQLYKLQATIMERTECVRRMASILEKPDTKDTIDRQKISKKEKSFLDYMSNENKSEIIRHIHNRYSGQRGRDVLRRILNDAFTQDDKLPSYQVFNQEFPDVITRSDYYEVRRLWVWDKTEAEERKKNITKL